jgi:alpha-methylacyl-CoA racemase
LCKALGLEQWIPHQTDDARQDEIRTAFRDAFAARDRDAWVAELAPGNACVAPVYSIAELAEDPHFSARNVFARAEHEERGGFRQLGPVLAGGDRALPTHRVSSGSATDTDGVFRAIGMTDREIDRLRAAGVME